MTTGHCTKTEGVKWERGREGRRRGGEKERGGRRREKGVYRIDGLKRV